ncbi:MAG: three-Cys-motif partner protein TcmP [Phycisphaerales bacterium]|nr:three-Cys-motif partner protein TcmP [Phycisphaerales bacterium]
MFPLNQPEDDGLYIPEVGAWSADKHHFLRRYIDAFTTSMRRKWPEMHYIDLFAGAGIERLGGGDLSWGSPLIAAQATHGFTQLHLVERDPKHFDALRQRIAKFRQSPPPHLLCGDANELVRDVVAALPAKDVLNLAFLDPYGLHLHYTTIRSLARHRTDLIIFFPDHLDALRNWKVVYHDQPDSNLDKVLGTDAWRRIFTDEPPSRCAELLRQLYEQQIRALGYKHFESERISGPGGRRLYLLLFCSKHDLGAKIWRGIASRKRDGQGTLPFG